MGAPQQIMLSAVAPAAGASLDVVNAWKEAAIATSAAITAAPSAGSLLVVCIATFTGDKANHGVSDNIDGTTGWNRITKSGATGVTDGGGHEYTMWYKMNAPAGITTITAIGGTGAVSTVAIAHEVTGASTTAAWTTDESIMATSAANSAWGPGNVNNATADSVLFGFYGAEDSGTASASFTLNGTGTTGTWVYESTTNSRELAGATWLMTLSVPNIIVNSTGNKTQVWQTLNTSTYNNGIIAAFH